MSKKYRRNKQIKKSSFWFFLLPFLPLFIFLSPLPLSLPSHVSLLYFLPKQFSPKVIRWGIESGHPCLRQLGVPEENALKHVNALITNCYITDYHKLRDIQPHIHYLIVARHQEPRYSLTGSSA